MLGGISAERDRTKVRRVRQAFDVQTFVEGSGVCSTESNALLIKRGWTVVVRRAMGTGVNEEGLRTMSR